MSRRAVTPKCGFTATQYGHLDCCRSTCQMWDHNKGQCLEKTKIELMKEQNSKIDSLMELFEEWLDSNVEKEKKTLPEINVFE